MIIVQSILFLIIKSDYQKYNQLFFNAILSV